MIGFKAYEMHTALNLHFTTDYDFFKYGGKTRVTLSSFSKNKFKWQYAAIENKYEKNMLLLFYLVYNKISFEYLSPKSLFYNSSKIFNDDISKEIILNSVRGDFIKHKSKIKNFFDVESIYPLCYSLYLDDELSIETLCLLDAYINKIFIDGVSNDKIFWTDVIKKMNKIQPFILSFINKRDFVYVVQER